MKKIRLDEGLGSIRKESDPKKTIKAYKLMRLENGKLYPLFIDSSVPTEIGVWYDADSPDLSSLRDKKADYYYLMNSNNEVIRSSKTKPTKEKVLSATEDGLRYMYIEKTEKKQRRFGENRKYWNIGINGSGTVATFSMRPGWHAGSLPTMRQIGKGKKKNLRDDKFVWTEIEISADIDYNPEAQRNPDKDIPDHIPTNGYYLKATNADKKKSQSDIVGWYVAGAMKINRIIGDKEARQIIDKFNKNHPKSKKVEYDYERVSGKDFNEKTMSLEGFDEDEFYDGLGRIDREELKKNIIDLVSNNIFKWRKPWGATETTGYFTKVKGKIVTGVVNGYTMRPYQRNGFLLLVYTQEYNRCYGTNFAPIFVSRQLVLRNKWKVIDRPLVIDPKEAEEDGFPTAWTDIYEGFWAKIKDEKQIKFIKEFLERYGQLPYNVIEAKDGSYLQKRYKSETVVLAQNIEGNPLNVEMISTGKAEMIEYVDKIIDAYSSNVAPLVHDQADRCFYRPSEDKIHMVNPKGFGEINEYYSTRFHETTHSTLHPSRLNRNFGSKKWGDAGYAEEELVAEIASYMLCSEFGIKYYRKDKAKPFSTKENSMAYIASWVKEAKKIYDDNEEKAILAAYEYAEKAVDYILKGVDFESLIPDRIKEMENKEYSDIHLFENDDLRVVNVRSDDRIRLFFKSIPPQSILDELKAEKFAYAKSFKAWQVINNEAGKKKVDAFLKKHYKSETEDRTRKLRLAKAKAKAIRIRQQQRQRQEQTSRAVAGINYDLD